MYLMAISGVTMSKCAGLWIEGMLQAEVLGAWDCVFVYLGKTLHSARPLSTQLSMN